MCASPPPEWPPEVRPAVRKAAAGFQPPSLSLSRHLALSWWLPDPRRRRLFTAPAASSAAAAAGAARDGGCGRRRELSGGCGRAAGFSVVLGHDDRDLAGPAVSSARATDANVRGWCSPSPFLVDDTGPAPPWWWGWGLVGACWWCRGGAFEQRRASSGRGGAEATGSRLLPWPCVCSRHGAESGESLH